MATETKLLTQTDVAKHPHTSLVKPGAGQHETILVVPRGHDQRFGEIPIHAAGEKHSPKRHRPAKQTHPHDPMAHGAEHREKGKPPVSRHKKIGTD